MAKSRSRLLAELSRGLRLNYGDGSSTDPRVQIDQQHDVVGGKLAHIGGRFNDPRDSEFDSDSSPIQVLDGSFDGSAAYEMPADGQLSFGAGTRGNSVYINAPLYVDSDERFHAGKQAFYVDNADNSNRIVNDNWSNGSTVEAIGGTLIYDVRAGKHFDSDLHELLVDSFLRKSRVRTFDPDLNRERQTFPGELHYNRPLQRLAREMSIKDLFDVETIRSPRVGDVLTWNGQDYAPGATGIVRNTVRNESGAVPSTSRSVSFSRSIPNDDILFFYNGHLLARDSETLRRDFAAWNAAYPGVYVNPTTDSDVDYRIDRDRLLVDDDTGAVTPAGTVFTFGQTPALGLLPTSEISVVYHFDERVHFYKSHWLGISDSDANQEINIRNGEPDSDITDGYSEPNVKQRQGDLLVFLYGMLLNPGDSEAYGTDYDVDSEQGSIVRFHIANDSEQQIEFAWLQGPESLGVGIIHELLNDSENFTTAGRRRFKVEAWDASSDVIAPEDSLVFLNGHLINNNPLIEYQVEGQYISFIDAFDSETDIAIVSFTGNKTTDFEIRLGDLSNVVDRVDNPTQANGFGHTDIGEPLVWNGTQWDLLSSQAVETSPLQRGWLRVTLDSDNPAISSNIYHYGFDSDWANNGSFRIDEGEYRFRVCPLCFPPGEWNPDEMTVQASVWNGALGRDGIIPQARVHSDSDGGPIYVEVRCYEMNTNQNFIDPIELHLQISGQRRNARS